MLARPRRKGLREPGGHAGRPYVKGRPRLGLPLFCLIIRHSLRQTPHTFDFLDAANALQDVDYLLEMLRIVYVDC